MPVGDIQAICELGQRQLMGMEYLLAERTLAEAEAVAWKIHDFDALSRLYLPLQEARRQRRQRCGEGIAQLDIWAQNPGDRLDPRKIVQDHPQGQLLVAGWQTIEPALVVRRLAAELGLYVDTFLASVELGGAIQIWPLPDSPPERRLIIQQADFPRGLASSSPETYGRVMALWERLHSPFLAEADAESDPMKKMALYRRTIGVDYACELAHQRLAEAARRRQSSGIQIS
jgi:hypothetical protein